MKTKHLHKIESSGFKAPKNYFDGLEDAILNEAKLKNISEGSGFKVPVNYFENFEVLVTKKAKVLPLYKNKAFAYVASIAAAAVLIFSLTFFNTINSLDNIDTATIDNYILNETETSDIASLFLENELTETQFINYNLNDDTIDSFIENEDVNDLMIE